MIEDGGDSDAQDEAAFWGIDVDTLHREQPGRGVWPQNVAAVRAFLAVCNQWRAVPSSLGGGRVIGLDYSAARAGLEMSGIEADPELWASVQVIEGAALAAMRES